MRLTWVIAGVFPIAAGLFAAPGAHSQPAMPAGQLVREVVYNELNDHARHGNWRYWIETRTANGTRREEQVETRQGPLTRLAMTDGRPLDAGSQQQERARLDHLLASPGEQARLLQQYNEDEQRTGRILALLPDAFLYEYAGEENGAYRLLYRPRPGFPTRTMEARIFHAMSGQLWIDARSKRLVRLDGQVDENVDFGFGLLGRLCKGGWFRLVRTQVSATDWKTTQIELHLNIRALLVNNFSREISEVRGGFEPVPSGIGLSQGLKLLDGPAPGAPVLAESVPAALAAPASFPVPR
jgi:hypothetical protein